MERRRIREGDVLRTLRAGVVGDAEWENGSWRHPVVAFALTVVVAFEGEVASDE